MKTQLLATEPLGESNILDTKIHAMQRIKRYGNGITGKQDMRVFTVYENVTGEILKKNRGY